MSVLNKMLQDLERRQHTSLASAPVRIQREESRPLWLTALLLLSAVLLVFAVYAILNRPQPDPIAVATVGELPQQPELLKPSAAGVVAPQAASTELAGTEMAGSDLAQPVATTTQQMTTSTADNHTEPAQISASEPAPATALLAAEIPGDFTKPVELNPSQAGQQPSAATDVKQPAAVVTASTDTVQQAAVSVAYPAKAKSAAEQAAILKQQAIVATAQSDVLRALALWQQAQALTPEQADSYLAQALLHQQLGQHERAQQVLQQALTAGAAHADIRLMLAQYYAAAGAWQDADKVLLPQYALAEFPQYYGLKATIAQQTGDFVSARHWYSQLIVLQPQQPRWWLGAALAYDNIGDTTLARQHYQQALQWGSTLSAQSRQFIQQRLEATQ